MRSTARLALLALVVWTAASRSAIAAPSSRQDSIVSVKSVLFIGNSLTYVNDLPGMVWALMRSGASHPVTVRVIAFPDYSLEDHWRLGEAQRVIASGHWDVVVLQQGPSSLDASRSLLVDYVRRFSRVIRSSGGRPALYMVWPTSDRVQDFPRSSESYRLAAADVGGQLLPVGDAWRAAWRRDSTLALFGPDGLHPSAAGSYLGALVIAALLTGRPALVMPDSLTLETGAPVTIPATTAALLRDAATEVIARTARE